MNLQILPKLAFITFAGLIVGVASFGAAHAVSNTGKTNGIAISPVKKEYSLDAGSTIEDSIVVFNTGDEPITINMVAEPYSVKDETYELDFLTVRKNTDFKSWVTFEKTTYVLEPNGSIKTPYTITVPADATPGGHYGAIFAVTQLNKPSSSQASLALSKRVGALVYATVRGDFEMGGNFLGIRTPVLQFKTPLKSEMGVENTGNSDFAVNTVFTVKDIFGNKKFTEAKEYQMLPQTSRKIQLQWSKWNNFGLYNVTVSGKFLDKEVTSSTYVLMAPLLFYMVFVVGLLIAIIVFVARRR